jgi:hypothetical protein
MTAVETREMLAPHFHDIYVRIFESAIDDLNFVMGAYPMKYSKRLKATFLNNIASNKAIDYFSTIDGVTYSETHESLHICINHKLVIRIKKVDDKNQSKNLKTKRNYNLFYHQTSIFSEYGRMTYIDAGYNLDQTYTKINKVSFTCRSTDELWSFYISPGTENNESVKTNEMKLSVKEETQLTIKKQEES